jgi:hypothetical protein
LEGLGALRGFLDDCWGAFEDPRLKLEEVLVLGEHLSRGDLRLAAVGLGVVGEPT